MDNFEAMTLASLIRGDHPAHDILERVPGATMADVIGEAERQLAGVETDIADDRTGNLRFLFERRARLLAFLGRPESPEVAGDRYAERALRHRVLTLRPENFDRLLGEVRQQAKFLGERRSMASMAERFERALARTPEVLAGIAAALEPVLDDLRAFRLEASPEARAYATMFGDLAAAEAMVEFAGKGRKSRASTALAALKSRMAEARAKAHADADAGIDDLRASTARGDLLPLGRVVGVVESNPDRFGVTARDLRLAIAQPMANVDALVFSLAQPWPES